MKELFIAAHEEMIEAYLLEHPEVEWAEAYEVTGEQDYARILFDRYRDKVASIADREEVQE